MTTELTTVKLLASLLEVGVKSKSQLDEIGKIVNISFSKEDISEAKNYKPAPLNEKLLDDMKAEINSLQEKLHNANGIISDLETKLAQLQSTVLIDTESLRNLPEDVLMRNVNKLVRVGANSKGVLYKLALPDIKDIIVKGVTHQIDLDEAREAASKSPNEQHISGITNAQVLTLAELA